MAGLASQLGELSELHVAGHLSEDEFARAKARLLQPEIAAIPKGSPLAPDAASQMAAVATAVGDALVQTLAPLMSAIAEGLGAGTTRGMKRAGSPVQPARSAPAVQSTAKRAKKTV